MQGNFFSGTSAFGEPALYKQWQFERVFNITGAREEDANAKMLQCCVRDYITDVIFFSHVLVTYHTHFKCYQFWRFAASSWGAETRGSCCCKELGDSSSPLKCFEGTCFSHSAHVSALNEENVYNSTYLTLSLCF